MTRVSYTTTHTKYRSLKTPTPSVHPPIQSPPPQTSSAYLFLSYRRRSIHTQHILRLTDLDLTNPPASKQKPPFLPSSLPSFFHSSSESVRRPKCMYIKPSKKSKNAISCTTRTHLLNNHPFPSPLGPGKKNRSIIHIHPTNLRYASNWIDRWDGIR